MSYRIAQDFEYVGNGYWRWWAWIEGDDAELDRVKEVVWILHPSFKRTRIPVQDRPNRFRLNTAGWGTFLLRAEVVLVDGEKKLLSHNLRLEFAEPAAAVAPAHAVPPSRPLSLFLSYSTQDSRIAAKLRENFKQVGFDVLDQTRIGAGEPWSEALRRMIWQSDAVVGFVGEDEISPWVSAEIEAAAAAGKPAFVLLAPGTSGAGIPSDVRTLQVDVSRFDPSQISDLLRSMKSS